MAVFVGDVWEFQGDPGAVLQVSGTHIPCSRLAWRCGQNNAWLAQVADIRFCGVYLRVLQPGQIYAGDKNRIVSYQG